MPKAPPCPHCKGAKFVRKDVPLDHPDFGRAIPCVCSQKELKKLQERSIYEASNLGGLRRLTFQAFEPAGFGLDETRQQNLSRAFSDALRYAAQPDGWLILMGGYGCGKTHLAAAIANRAVRNGKQALLVVVPDLLDILRSSFAPTSSMPYDKRFDQVRRSELLVLDDLGTQSATPWAVEKLFQLFNYRYNAQLPTVITLNDIDAVDPRLLQRMMDMQSGGRGAPLDLDIPPYDGGSKGRSRLHRR